MELPKITGLCLDWHVDKSDAFRDMLVDPLATQANIVLKAWDGIKVPSGCYKDELVIFCMLPPSQSFLNKYKGKNVWLPMWDQARGYSQDWWNKLPKNLHVVSFSRQVTEKAKVAGLPLIELKYFTNPNLFKPARWDKGKVVFYWNRTGLVGPDFLRDFCNAIAAKKLIFLGDIDPRIETNKAYNLPSKLGDTKVLNLKHTNREGYLDAVCEANIFIAPRSSEGVGMTFLEAMAKGSAVIAYDAPTMNEYIDNKRNGVLLRNQPLSIWAKLLHKSIPDKPSSEAYYLKSTQNWSSLSRINYRSLGSEARQDHLEGYQKWLASMDDYAEFVLQKN